MNVMNSLNGKALQIEERCLVDKHGNVRAGNYMHTSGGHKFWPFDPKPEEFHIETMAHHTANQCRYNGATQSVIHHDRIFYSVAEHSRYVAEYLRDDLGRPDLELEGYLHDAIAEAFIGDLIRPLKYSPSFRAPFFEVEELNEKAGAERFNLAYPFPKEVKLADEAVTAAEVRQVIIYDPEDEWKSGLLHEDAIVAEIEIQMLEPYAAKQFYLEGLRQALDRRHEYRPLPADLRW